MNKEASLTKNEVKLAAIVAKLYSDLRDKKLDVAVINVLQEAGLECNAQVLDRVYAAAQKLPK